MHQLTPDRPTWPCRTHLSTRFCQMIYRGSTPRTHFCANLSSVNMSAANLSTAALNLTAANLPSARIQVLREYIFSASMCILVLCCETILRDCVSSASSVSSDSMCILKFISAASMCFIILYYKSVLRGCVFSTSMSIGLNMPSTLR